jgi:general secretion pathway protein A
MIRQAAAETYDLGSEHNDRRSTWLKVAGLLAGICVLLTASIYIAMRYADTRVTQAVSTTRTKAPAESPAPSAPAVAAEGSDIAAAKAVSADTLENFLQMNPGETSTKIAFESLFKLWGIPYPASSARACEYAEAKDLFCLLENGSLPQLQTLNHPAILTLVDNAGGIHQVVLATITGSSAKVYAGAEVMIVPLAELTQLWNGEYLLIWKPQTGSVKSFSPGMQDVDIVWLRNSLASIQGSPVEPMASEYFDDVLEARVREYQVSRNLTVDGMVGPKTQILINADLGTEAPRLNGAN